MDEFAPVDAQVKKEMFESEKQEAKHVRKSKSGELTCKMNKITELMSDPHNLKKVEENFHKYTNVRAIECLAQ